MNIEDIIGEENISRLEKEKYTASTQDVVYMGVIDQKLSQLVGQLSSIETRVGSAVSSAAEAAERANNAASNAEETSTRMRTIADSAEKTSEAAARALPNILTVMSILITAVTAIASVYLSTIINRISTIEGNLAQKIFRKTPYANHQLFAFSQSLLQGLIIFNLLWLFIYLCSLLIDRLWYPSDRKASFLNCGFVLFVTMGNFVIIVVYILLRVFPNYFTFI